jgi:peptidoglycan glycosyltransferase
MRGAHVCAVPRRLGRGPRGARGLGWWQPPTRAAAAGRRAEPVVRPPRHRNPEPTEPLTVAVGPAPRHRVRRAVALGAAVLALGPLAAATPGFLLIDVPGPDQVVRGSAALIAYRDGAELFGLARPAAERPGVRLDRLPGPVRDAVLAVRDPGFDTRAAVDPAPLLHAVAGSGAPEPVVDQFADHALAGVAGTPWRAYRQVVLVSKLTATRSRDQLLTDYLDSVYLGRGDYGLAAGALDYFGRDVADLTLEQGALLAALVDQPLAADPANDPRRAEQLWGRVLDAMVAGGRLDPQHRAAARFPPAFPRRPGAGLPADGRAPTVAAVLTELRGLGFDDAQLALGGLRVTTTLDPVRQDRASTAAAQAERGAAVGIVTVDPATGGVLVYHGGKENAGDDAARVPQPVGAALAPLVLAAGQLQDPPVTAADCAGCATGGLAALVQRIGPAAVAATAAAAGIGTPSTESATAPGTGPETAPATTPAAPKTAPKTAPGSAVPAVAGADPTRTDVDAVELASAYATLAAGGVRRPAHLVASVTAADGRVLYQAPGGGERRLPEDAARAGAPAEPVVGPWAAGVVDGVATAVRVAPGSAPAGIAAPAAPAPVAPAATADAGTTARAVWTELTAG